MAGRIKHIYPDVRNLLQVELHRIKDERNMSHKELADKCKVSTGHLSDVVNGKKTPSDDFNQAFAKVAHPTDLNARKKLISSIEDAARTVEDVLDTLRERLKNGGKLRVTTTDYYPIAGTSQSFFEGVFERFLTLAGIKSDPPRRRDADMHSNVGSDFSLGLFDSADRMLKMDTKFWRVPARMGLNAVCLRKHQKHGEEIALLLTKENHLGDGLTRPIVIAEDVGWRHCVTSLSIPEEQITKLPRLSVDKLADHLLKSGQKGDQIPVICTDEFTCLRILGELGDKGYLVFSMNSRRTWQNERENARRELPRFYCSVGVDGNHREFQEFMQDALEQFLSTEISTTAHAWKRLAVELAEAVSKISADQMPIKRESKAWDDRLKVNPKLRKALSWAQAWEWVFYTLNLDLEAIDSFPNFNNLPWKPILQYARDLVQAHLAEQYQLNDCVQLFWDSNEGKNRLCSLLDVELGSEFRSLPHPYIVRALQRELTGMRVLPLVVRKYDPNLEHEAALAMRRFMRSLQNVYDGLKRDNAVGRLRLEIDEMMDQSSIYGNGSGSVILARLAENNSFIGGACLLWNEKHEMYELRYLWVDPQYRGFSVGKEIIDEVFRVALVDHRSNGLYVEILDKELLTAAAVFKETFVNSDMPPSDEGRIVLERRR